MNEPAVNQEASGIYEFSLIPSEQISLVWNQVEEYLKKSAKRSDGRTRVEDIFYDLINNQTQLWIIFDTGNLKNSWQHEIQPFTGEVFTTVEYAEPVAYGTSLPPSWGGRYRTRQNTIKGYPELIAKQLEGFIADEFRRE